MKLGQKAICTMPDGEKYKIKVVSLSFDETNLILKILTGKHKGKYSILAKSELDSSIEWIPDSHHLGPIESLVGNTDEAIK